MDAHAQYLVDCATEFGELTALESIALYQVPQIQARFESECEQFRGKDAIVNFVRDQLELLPLVDQYMLALFAFDPQHCQSIWQNFLGRAQHLVQRKISLDLQWCRPVASLDCETGIWGDLGPVRFQDVTDIEEPQVVSLLQHAIEGQLNRWKADVQLFANAQQWALECPDEVTSWIAVRQAELFSSSSCREVRAQGTLSHQGNADMQRMKFMRELQAEQTRAKKAVRKAFRLFEKSGKSHQVGLLIGGSEVTISHPSSAFKFIVKPHSAGWLLSKTVTPGGSAPFTIELLTKEDLFLGKLCVYFKDTPVLDQLMALSLFIESGEESQVLQAANWFSVTQEANAWVLEHTPQYSSKVQFMTRPGDTELAMFEIGRDAQLAPYKALVGSWVSGYLGSEARYPELPQTLRQALRTHLQTVSAAQLELTQARVQQAVTSVQVLEELA